MADQDPKATATAAEAEKTAEQGEGFVDAIEQRLAELQAEQVRGTVWDKQSRVLGKEGINATTTEDVSTTAATAAVKVGTSSAKTDTEGEEMSKEDVKKMQAMLGAAKSKDSKVYSGLVDKEIVINPGDVDPRATLIVANCKNCTFEINSLSTKIFVQSCSNIKLACNAKIVTHMVEMYKCENIDASFKVKIGTMQLDMSSDLSLKFDQKEHFGCIIWAGCHRLSMAFGDSDDTILTGFGDMQEDYADLHIERSQFKLHFVNNKLVNEKVIRLPNGFPTTKREKDAFEARQERNLKAMAEKMGINLPNKRTEEVRVGRNEPCSCGSGRKYKKCCGVGVPA